jgi:hypothetical protein
VNDVFHVSQLKKCEQIPEGQIIEEINAETEPDISLAEYPMRVLDQKERQTRRGNYVGDQAVANMAPFVICLS